MSKYVRLSENYKNNVLVPAEDSPYKWVSDKSVAHFTSMVYYSEDDFKEWEKTKSLKGIRGSLTSKIWADFDSADNLKQAFKDGAEFVNRLVELGIKEDAIQASFTGNKGIGLIVDTDEMFHVEQVRALCLGLGKDLSTLDRSVYDNQRIMRLLLTRNEKSGLYKIPITLEELREANVELIKSYAKDISVYNIDEINKSYSKTSLNDNIKKRMIAVTKEATVRKLEPIEVDIANKPKNWRNCKWSLLQGNFPAGQRNQALMIIASTAKGLGYDKTTAYYLAKGAIKKQSAVTGQEEFSKEELYNNIIEVVYSPGWQGGQYSCKKEGWLRDYCNSLDHPCKHDDTETKEAAPKKIDEVHPLFKDFVMNIEKNTIKTGLAELDVKMPITIGMNLGVVAAPGVGKTSWALEVLRNTSKDGVTSVFASLDMHRTRLFEKLMYKVSGGMGRNDLYEKIKNNEEGDLVDKIKEDYSNVYFYDRSSPTVADIRAYIERVNAEAASPVKLVMIDYFERINSDRSEETSASKDIAGQLQDLVNDFNVALITLVQPNKMSINGGPDTPIKSYTAIKGSSFLYQSFRGILSMWRPFLTPETMHQDKYIQFGILKNDLGQLGVVNFVFEGKTGTIRPMASPEERRQLDLWLEEKENLKNEKSSKSDGWD